MSLRLPDFTNQEDTGLNFRMQSLFDQIAGEVPFGKGFGGINDSASVSEG